VRRAGLQGGKAARWDPRRRTGLGFVICNLESQALKIKPKLFIVHCSLFIKIAALAADINCHLSPVTCHLKVCRSGKTRRK